MSNAIFPTLPGLKWGSTKTPVWKTVVHESVSGMELRHTLMSYPRYRISMAYEFLYSNAKAELQQILGFFNARRGSWDDFLWLDTDDYVVSAYQFGTGDGASKNFIISRSYGGFQEPVQDFVSAPTITIDGVTQSAATYSITNGVITFTTAPSAGAAIRWSGQFYKRVRFAKDELEFTAFMRDLWEAKRVDLITVKK